MNRGFLAVALLLLASGIAFAGTLTVTLNAPTSDPDLNTGQTFVLNLTVTCSGSFPNCANVVLHAQYCAGAGCSNWTDIPTSATGLTANVSTYTIGAMTRTSSQTRTFLVTGNSNNTFRVRGQSTSTSPGGTQNSGTQTVTVRSPAALTATIGAAPASVADGATITVTMNITNTGQRGANGVTPSSLIVTPTGTASAAFAGGPAPASAAIAGGASQAFTWTYTANGGASGGTVTFSGNAAGTDAKTGGAVTSNTPISNGVTVAARPTASGTLTAPSSDPDINTGQTFTLSVQVSCSSGTCTNVVVYPRYCSGSLSCTPNTDITTVSSGLTSNVNSVTFATLSSGSPQTANFTITGATNNTYTVGGRFTSTNNNGNASGTQGVSVKNGASLTASITASPSQVYDGENITVTMTVSNTGQRAAVNVTPSALNLTGATGTASVSFGSGPLPTIANITGGGSQNFVWNYTAISGTDGGNVSFSGNASGKDNKTGGTVTAANANSNVVVVRLKPTNLAVWDETAPGMPYAGLTKYVGDPVMYFANFTRTSDNASLSNASCNISIYNGTAWTAWAAMSWNGTRSLFIYNYTTGFQSGGSFAWNATCGQTSYVGQAASNSTNITVRASNLAVWDDTDTAVRYIGDQVYFLANYTMANGTIIDGTGVCQVAFNITGGWTAWANMTYNTSSTPYYYNRSFGSGGAFNFNVTCSKLGYQPRNATSTFNISALAGGGTVTTGKATYSAGCVPIYYRVRLFDTTNFLVNSAFDLNITDSANVSRQSGLGLTPNNGTGVYTNSVIANSSQTGSWLIRATSSPAAGTGAFSVIP